MILDVNGNTIDYTFSLSAKFHPITGSVIQVATFLMRLLIIPTLYLTRGVKYIFKDIPGSQSVQNQSTIPAGGTLYNVGVTNNNGTGTVTFTFIMTASDELYYYCNAHSSMNGTIKIIGAGGNTGDITSPVVAQ